MFAPGTVVIHTVNRTYFRKDGTRDNKPTKHLCTVLKAGLKTCLVQFENKVVKTVKLDSLQAFN